MMVSTVLAVKRNIEKKGEPKSIKETPGNLGRGPRDSLLIADRWVCQAPPSRGDTLLEEEGLMSPSAIFAGFPVQNLLWSSNLKITLIGHKIQGPKIV